MLSKTMKMLKGDNNKDRIIMGIDSSSRSLAFSVFFRGQSGETVLMWAGKVDMANIPTMRGKLDLINIVIPEIFALVGPVDKVVIEQTIYIQSPQTSRILSYIVGHTWGKCLEFCDDVSDIPIMTWKSHIGYKNVSKSEKDNWEKTLGKTEAKKKAAFERKQRTIDIVHKKIPNSAHIDDNDICDAIGIGLWAVSNA